MNYRNTRHVSYSLVHEYMNNSIVFLISTYSGWVRSNWSFCARHTEQQGRPRIGPVQDPRRVRCLPVQGQPQQGRLHQDPVRHAGEYRISKENTTQAIINQRMLFFYFCSFFLFYA